MTKVTWDAQRCEHSGICLDSLPAVFRIEDGQFIIDDNAARASQIREVCDACPSGALRFHED